MSLVLLVHWTTLHRSQQYCREEKKIGTHCTVGSSGMSLLQELMPVDKEKLFYQTPLATTTCLQPANSPIEGAEFYLATTLLEPVYWTHMYIYFLIVKCMQPSYIPPSNTVNIM